MTEIEYDFTQLADGNLPPTFGYAIIVDDGGALSTEPEENPSEVFYIKDSVAVFHYTEELAGTKVRGVLASPIHFAGSDISYSVVFDNPLSFWSIKDDEFVFQLGIGYRGSDQLANWFGGLIEAHWEPSGWDPKWRFSLVEFADCEIIRHETLEEASRFVERNEISLDILGDDVTVVFNGIKSLVKNIDMPENGQAALFIRAYTEKDSIKTPFGVLTYLHARELKSGYKRPIYEFPTQFIQPEACEAHFYRVPVKELLANNIIKSIAPNMWQFTQDIKIYEGTLRCYVANKGAIVVAHRNLLEGDDYQMCKFKYDTERT